MQYASSHLCGIFISLPLVSFIHEGGTISVIASFFNKTPIELVSQVCSLGVNAKIIFVLEAYQVEEFICVLSGRLHENLYVISHLIDCPTQYMSPVNMLVSCSIR